MKAWVKVPRIPTDAMLRAAQRAWLNDPLRRTTSMWQAMLEAAPQHPEPQETADMRMTGKLAEALRRLPNDHDMIGRDDLGGDLQLTCCGGRVALMLRGDDRIEHEKDCWFARLVAAAREAQQP